MVSMDVKTLMLLAVFFVVSLSSVIPQNSDAQFKENGTELNEGFPMSADKPGSVLPPFKVVLDELVNVPNESLDKANLSKTLQRPMRKVWGEQFLQYLADASNTQENMTLFERCAAMHGEERCFNLSKMILEEILFGNTERSNEFLMTGFDDIMNEVIRRRAAKVHHSAITRTIQDSSEGLLTTPELTGLDEIHRVLRSLGKCEIPEEFENFNLSCIAYPTKIKCNQNCMFGHTFPEGIVRPMECEYDINRWMPTRKFENCRPFVDCTVMLGYGGKMKCITHRMDRGPECEISCASYEDNEPVEAATYTCDIDGKWTPDLPFCALPGTAMLLAKRPKHY